MFLADNVFGSPSSPSPYYCLSLLSSSNHHHHHHHHPRRRRRHHHHHHEPGHSSIKHWMGLACTHRTTKQRITSLLGHEFLSTSQTRNKLWFLKPFAFKIFRHHRRIQHIRHSRVMHQKIPKDFVYVFLILELVSFFWRETIPSRTQKNTCHLTERFKTQHHPCSCSFSSMEPIDSWPDTLRYPLKINNYGRLNFLLKWSKWSLFWGHVNFRGGAGGNLVKNQTNKVGPYQL